MSRKLAGVALVAGLFCAAPLAQARAADVCTTGSLVFCFDFTFSNNSFAVTFNPNGSTFGSTGFLTDIGLFGYSSITGTPSITATQGTGWTASLSTNGNCSGLGNGNDVGVTLPFELCATPQGGAGLGNNGMVTISFTGNTTANVGADVHIQSVNNTECSLHINSNGTLSGNTGNCGPVTTTPEPASLALMATGLFAVGGIGAVRRRRRTT